MAYFGVHEMAAENPAFAYFIDLEKPEGDYIFGTDVRHCICVLSQIYEHTIHTHTRPWLVPSLIFNSNLFFHCVYA